jgi:pyridoxal biosynthesis lyase PdxS
MTVEIWSSHPDLGIPMAGINVSSLAEADKIAKRGW